MVVVRTNLIAGTGEIITEFPDDVRFDLILALPGSGQEDGAGGGFGALDALRVVVGDICCQLCRMPGGLQRGIQPAHGGDPHGRTVAVAAVGLGIPGAQPAAEPAAIARVGILPTPLLHGLHQCCPNDVVRLSHGVHQGLCHRDGHDGIVRKLAAPNEQREILRFVTTVELIGRSDHISKYRSVHLYRLR